MMKLQQNFTGPGAGVDPKEFNRLSGKDFRRELNLQKANIILYAGAREIHVSKAGRDSGAGNHDDPYVTICRAARVASPACYAIGTLGAFWLIERTTSF